MKKEIATGIQDFEKLRQSQGFYVDKTDLIQEWWRGLDDVTLITRPRRFGKTLNMSMLNCFFSNKYENRNDLFENLNIWKDTELRAEQGKWPVISLSFAGIKPSSFSEAKQEITQLITRLYNEYSWMLKDKRFTEADRKFFASVRPDMEDHVTAISLNYLCGWLEKFYGRRVLIFLDEYDTPMQEAYIHGFWDEMVLFIRKLFNNTFKTNTSMYRAIMTGITRVSKESIFSDLNNLVVVTTTSNMYATCFGFTEPEVFKALEEQGFDDKSKVEVKTWYDGFTFGSHTDIYNPWSVTNYLEQGRLATYWANTSGNGLISTLLRQGDPGIKMQFETLLAGGMLTVSIDEQIIFNQLDHQGTALWSLLLASGYLKVIRVETKTDSKGRKRDWYALTLTNLEVEMMFEDMVRGWFEEGKYFGKFVTAMFRGNVEDMEDYLGEIMLSTMSFFDGEMESETKTPEKFYHGLVLGLLVDQTNAYEIRSNRESGFGRYDVMLEPKNTSDPAIIMEFKVFNPRRGEKDLKDTVDNALKQIEKMKYETELLARGIPEDHILKYGFAFRGKECLIRKAAKH